MWRSSSRHAPAADPAASKGRLSTGQPALPVLGGRVAAGVDDEEGGMTVWAMVAVAVVVVALPFVLMFAFNGADRADSRGRRINRRWHH